MFSFLRTFFLSKSECPNKELYIKYRTVLYTDLQNISSKIKHLENKKRKQKTDLRTGKYKKRNTYNTI